MVNVAVVYFSGAGHTRKMAEAVLTGAQQFDGCVASLLEIQGTDITQGRWQNDAILAALDEADAIILGSPTYMGNIAAQMKAFMDATGERYFRQAWKNKVASAFTVSGAPSGDKFNSLVTFATFAMQHGMIWVGLGLTTGNPDGTNRLAFYFGAGGQALMEPPDEAPNDQDKQTGQILGERVAAIAAKLKT